MPRPQDREDRAGGWAATAHGALAVIPHAQTNAVPSSPVVVAALPDRTNALREQDPIWMADHGIMSEDVIRKIEVLDETRRISAAKQALLAAMEQDFAEMAADLPREELATPQYMLVKHLRQKLGPEAAAEFLSDKQHQRPTPPTGSPRASMTDHLGIRARPKFSRPPPPKSVAGTPRTPSTEGAGRATEARAAVVASRRQSSIAASRRLKEAEVAEPSYGLAPAPSAAASTHHPPGTSSKKLGLWAHGTRIDIHMRTSTYGTSSKKLGLWARDT